jgi:hypothetical protein
MLLLIIKLLKLILQFSKGLLSVILFTPIYFFITILIIFIKLCGIK